jgi:hypothetical protein
MTSLDTREHFGGPSDKETNERAGRGSERTLRRLTPLTALANSPPSYKRLGGRPRSITLRRLTPLPALSNSPPSYKHLGRTLRTAYRTGRPATSHKHLGGTLRSVTFRRFAPLTALAGRPCPFLLIDTRRARVSHPHPQLLLTTPSTSLYPLH